MFEDALPCWQVTDMCLAVIRCAVENNAFVHVNNYVSKARSAEGKCIALKGLARLKTHFALVCGILRGKGLRLSMCWVPVLPSHSCSVPTNTWSPGCRWLLAYDASGAGSAIVSSL